MVRRQRGAHRTAERAAERREILSGCDAVFRIGVPDAVADRSGKRVGRERRGMRCGQTGQHSLQHNEADRYADTNAAKSTETCPKVHWHLNLS
jgi:hypothetical protein